MIFCVRRFLSVSSRGSLSEAFGTPPCPNTRSRGTTPGRRCRFFHSHTVFPQKLQSFGCETRPRTNDDRREGSCRSSCITHRSVGGQRLRSDPSAERANEGLDKDVSKDFGRHARGYVQRRISGPFELDNDPLALFYLLLQGSYRLDVDLATHTQPGPHGVSTTKCFETR